MFLSDALCIQSVSVGFLSTCGTLTTLLKSGGRFPRVTIGPLRTTVNLSCGTVPRRAPRTTPLQGHGYRLDTIDLNGETSIICRFILSPLFIYPLLISSAGPSTVTFISIVWTEPSHHRGSPQWRESRPLEVQPPLAVVLYS